MLETPTHDVQIPRHSRLVNGSPVFYGWIILLAGTLGLILTGPGQTYTVSIFIEHFIRDLGISRSLVSTLYTIGTLAGSFALPIVGRQIDQRGPRMMIAVISFFFGLACIYMGLVQNALMLGLGFVAIRMLGQGGLQLVSQNVINQWWVRRRGMAMGLSGLATSLLGLGAFPNFVNWLISLYGWRMAYILQGVMLLAGMVPLGILLYRNRPEDYGLQPDGRSRQDTPASEVPVEVLEENWTLAEAIRTPTFWVLTVSLSSIAMLGTGLFFHMVSIFEDSGLPASVAASAFLPISATMALVNLGSGFLVDRMRIRLLLATGLVLQAVALWMARSLPNAEFALLYGIVLGTTFGLMLTVRSVIWAKYYGRRHLGSISGLTATISVASSALGPMPLGIARDLLGSYDLALTIAAVIPLVLSVVSLSVDRPHKA